MSIKNLQFSFSVIFITMLPLVLFFNSCTTSKTNLPNDLTQFVDPFIGSDFNGHVFVGANVPFGAVQIGPTNYIKGWNWTSGYHYSDSIVTGFSHLHLSGTGIGDLGDVLISPFTGEKHFTPGTISEPLKGYASLYSHDREIAEAGYYKVDLLDYDVRAELTASERVGFHRYTFPATNEARIAINLEMGIGWDIAEKTMLKQLNDTTLVGYRYSRGWASDQRVHFAIVLSKPLVKLEFRPGNNLISEKESQGKDVVALLSYCTSEGEQIMLKVGISPISYQGALNNIEKEIPHWDFEKTREQAREKWNRELAKIEFFHPDESEMRTFYTAMYHAFYGPVLYNDHDRSYKGTDRKVYSDPGFDNYTTFSLWDTYRALHPLFTIVQTERMDDMINSMLNIYEHQGKLPIWHLMGCETNTMVGYSAVPVVADAVFKGFTGFDRDLAYESVVNSSMVDEDGLTYLKELGFIPADLEQESVSKALEYALADWAIAEFAKMRGDSANAAYYRQRAKAYTIYFDPETRFIRPVLQDGTFKSPFNPFESIHEGYAWTDYTEGNAWQYTFLVPHDVKGLIDLMGGDEAFDAKLDSLFFVTGELGEFASPDISGLVGQYAQGNEPSHHTAYMFNYTGSQYKTARKVRFIMDEWYTDEPNGLPGNEDCGQMSAWYIFSSLGFYPVNSANSVFAIGSPVVHKATINLPGNKKFSIVAHNNSSENIYVQKIRLNGKELLRSYITYKEIMQGGKLEYFMGKEPGFEFGKAPKNRPLEVLIN
jgi:predicted alpha-1,2-mannosidase